MLFLFRETYFFLAGTLVYVRFAAVFSLEREGRDCRSGLWVGGSSSGKGFEPYQTAKSMLVQLLRLDQTPRSASATSQ